MEENREDYCIPMNVLLKAMFRDLDSLAQTDNNRKCERKTSKGHREYRSQLYDNPCARIERDFWRTQGLSP